MKHRSPGLTAIYNEVKSSKQNRILDLGSLVAANFSFLSALSCKIHFENLDEFIIKSASLSSENITVQLEKFLLKHDKGDSFDVILAWDFINYLPLEAVQRLFNLLESYCKPNTLLHCIKYVNTKIPSQPARFRIVDQYYLDIDTRQSAPRAVSNHATAALLKHMPQYYLHNNIMNEQGMANGVAEQVMRFRADKNMRKQYVASTELHRVETAAVSVSKPIKRTETKESDVFTEQYFASPAIQATINRAMGKAVLDLGIKSSQNMEFWRNHFHQVYAEDLPSSLHWRNFANDVLHDGRPRPISDEALRFDEQVKFDLVVLWDCFNFCKREQIAAVGERLLPYCSENTRFLIISYSGIEIPAQPQRFTLIDEGYRCVENPRKGPRPFDSVTTAGIMKLIPEWVIEKTYVYSPGMKRGLGELLFRANPLCTQASLRKLSSNEQIIG